MIKINFCKPFIIEDDRSVIFGIYRGKEDPQKIVVFVPAMTGTRIGPQRMFVEISNQIVQNGISAVCIDLPMAGDSYDKKQLRNCGIRAYYEYYLEKVYKFLSMHYSESEIIFSSISVGCMPVLEFSEGKRLNKVILLSPNHLSSNTSLVNKHNINAYCIKLFQFNTWKKLFFLKLDFTSILSNIFSIKNQKKKKKNKHQKIEDQPITNKKVSLLCIFSKNDPELTKNQTFWELNKRHSRFVSYSEYVIADSDHSFMEWNSKKELIIQISNWLN